MAVRLRVLEILEEKHISKYELNKRMGSLCYRNFSNIICNRSKSIRFETIEKLANALEVPIGDLFVQVEDDKSDN